MTLAVTAVEDNVINAEDTLASAADPSLYSAVYPPHYPYEGGVARISTNIIQAPNNFGHVAAFHKMVGTPFSSVHKSDTRYTNNVQPHHLAAARPYTNFAGPHPYATRPHQYPIGPHPYPEGLHPYVPAAKPYPYAGTAAGPYLYAVAPIKTHGYVPAATSPYNYDHAATRVVTPHSVTHASFFQPYEPHYSYKQ